MIITPMESLSNIFGWLGMLLVLLAYFLISTKKVQSNSRSYQVLNLLGAVFIGVNVFYETAWPSVALQIAWALIAIKSLIRND